MESGEQGVKLESFKVPLLEKRVRLSDFVPGIFSSITSHTGMKNAIKKGLVKVDGTVGYTGDYIEGGEVIELFQSDAPLKIPVLNLEIEVFYEDDYLAIVNKPAGLLVSGNRKWTLMNALPPNLKKSTQRDALNRPHTVHRLDFATSGALLVGKTASVTGALNKLFETRQVEKIYTAITIGEMDGAGTITTPIDGKEAHSAFKVLQREASLKYGFLNMTQLVPHTGRRHQLRKHMSEAGHPILGDAVYGVKGSILKGKGLFLHATTIKFLHPVTGKAVTVTAPLPGKFKKQLILNR